MILWFGGSYTRLSKACGRARSRETSDTEIMELYYYQPDVSRRWGSSQVFQGGDVKGELVHPLLELLDPQILGVNVRDERLDQRVDVGPREAPVVVGEHPRVEVPEEGGERLPGVVPGWFRWIRKHFRVGRRGAAPVK